MKLLIIFNPKAQAGRSLKLLPAIQKALELQAIDAEIVHTRRPGHATELVRNADLRSFDAVLAAGGDGSLFEVLNGLYAHERSDRVPLAVLPMGTGNAFARDFGLFPGNWQTALDLIANRRIRKVDVGRVRCAGDAFHFLNIAGIGLPTAAGMTAKKLKFMGNAAYTLGTLWQTLRLKSYPLAMELDGRLFEQENVFVEVSNSRYTGTSFLIAPDAQIDDGLLDVTVLKNLSRIRLLRLFPTVYSGGHLEFDEVETFRARHMRIELPVEMPITVDGEFRGQTPVEIECLNRDLDLLC